MNEKEELSNFSTELDRIIDSVKESTSRSKDYYKFVIGLSTGVLVFSPSLIEKFNRFPTCKPIMLTGYLCLIISIIMGVLLLRKQDLFESLVRSIKTVASGPPSMIFGIEQDVEKFLARNLVSGFLQIEMAKEPKNEERIKKLKNELLIPDGTKQKDLIVKMLSIIKEIYPPLAQATDDIIKEAKSWGDFLRKRMKTLYIPNMSKKFRQTTILMHILEKVMMVSFFAGVILTTLFSAINILSIDIISVICNLF